jgi:DNA repair photolyase
MYEWVMWKHTHLRGECAHRCPYCYVQHGTAARTGHYAGALRLAEHEFAVKYGTRRTIFIEHCNDLFAAAVPDAWIRRILAHTRLWPQNTFVFQTKNPARVWDFLQDMPPNRLIGTTIESNRDHPRIRTTAPRTDIRALSLQNLKRTGEQVFVTIEPIMDFDLEILVSWLEEILPVFVAIGADSKYCGLEEPGAQKVKSLIAELEKRGIEVRQKKNLARLLPNEPHTTDLVD